MAWETDQRPYRNEVIIYEVKPQFYVRCTTEWFAFWKLTIMTEVLHDFPQTLQVDAEIIPKKKIATFSTFFILIIFTFSAL